MALWLKEGFRDAGLILLVVVGVLLLAVLAIAMRPLLIVLALVALGVSLLLYRFRPGFREWFESSGEEQISYNGLHLATDVAVHPNHSWARVRGKEAVVGADDLVQSTLGPVQAVELPPIGSRVAQGDRLFRLRRGDRCVEVRSPLSGTIVAANDALREHPGLVNDDPFERGWAVRIKADRFQKDPAPLLRGSQARGWFRQEIDRLLSTVLGQAALQPALPDGGTFVAGLYREIDEDAWKKLTESFFGGDRQG
jgi:glycine cleavage system H lipoate-binding protein